jgi:hypothetical protein
MIISNHTPFLMVLILEARFARAGVGLVLGLDPG